jgi:tRNA-dihydrouridine synthase B
VAAVKRAVRVPVVANGDIDTPARAKAVLDATGADAVMIGRAAQGRPWIFGEVAAYLDTGIVPPPPHPLTVKCWLLEHLEDHYALYGEAVGVRSARKHIGWTVRGLPAGETLRAAVNMAETAHAQTSAVAAWFDRLAGEGGQLH